MRTSLMAVPLIALMVACSSQPNVTPPPPPGALTISSSTPASTASGIAVDTNITVTFSRPMNTSSVSVTASPTTDLGASTWGDGDTTLTLNPPANLAPGTAYTLSLEGKDKSGAALTGSKTITFTTASAADPAPATPANPSAKPGDASVTVSWDANTETDLKTYTVYWGASSNTLPNSITVDKTQTSKTITGLTNGAPYFFALSAADTAGNASAKTASISATPLAPPPPGDTTPPAVPTNLAASAGDGEINLSWTQNPEPDLKGYNVYSGTTAGSLTLAGFVDKTGAGKKFTGLTNGTAYSYAIDAEDTSGNKSARTVAVGATPKDATAPTLVSSTPANGATNVPFETDYVFKFSEPMDKDSLKLNCALNGNQPCTDELLFSINHPVWSDGDRTATVLHTVAFKATATAAPTIKSLSGDTSTFTITGRDKAGNALANDTKIAFTFVPEPPQLIDTITSDGPPQTTTVRDFRILFKFSKPMNLASVTNAFTLKIAGNTVPMKSTLTKDGVEFSPASLVPYSSTVEWRLQGRVQSTDGGDANVNENNSFDIPGADQITLTSDPAGDGYTSTTMNGNIVESRAVKNDAKDFIVGDERNNATFYQGYLSFKLPKGAIPDNVTDLSSNLRLTKSNRLSTNTTADLGPMQIYSVPFSTPLSYTADFPNPDAWDGGSDPYTSTIPFTPANGSAVSTIGMGSSLIRWQWKHRNESGRNDASSYLFQYRLSYVLKDRQIPISANNQSDNLSFYSGEATDLNTRPQLTIYYRISGVGRQ